MNSAPIPIESGGKGASLQALCRMTRVPDFTVLPAAVFRDFLASADLLDMYRESWELGLQSPRDPQAAQVRKVLQRWCLLGPIPQPLKKQISDQYQAFAGRVCAARSSATVEDGQSLSWAGQFDTITGIGTEDNWVKAVRQCWASTLRPGVMAYGRVHQASPQPPEMAIVLQEMVDARSSGVWFPFDPATGNKYPILECNLGLGGPLVSGRIVPERWQMDKNQMPVCIQDLRASAVHLLANQESARPGTGRLLSPRIEVRKDTQPVRQGIWAGTPVSNFPGTMRVLSQAEATAIFAEAEKLALSSRIAVEMEWAIDQQGKLYWLQMRPVTTPAPVSRPETKTENGQALCQGLCAHPGRVEGIAWEYGQPRPEAEVVILIKEELSPQDIELAMSVQGIVARDGSLLSHTAIVCRELKKPCLVGAWPFPPEIQLHGRPLVLSASSGQLLPQGMETPPAPAIPAVLPAPPGPRPKPGLIWPDNQTFQEKVPFPLRTKLERISRLPRIVSPIEVLPDLRERQTEAQLGFPIGLVFKSTCFHPAATCDMGDGFRLMQISGASQEEVRARLPLLEAQMRHVFSYPPEEGPALDRVFRNGLNALRGTPWEEPDPQLVEEEGMVRGAHAGVFEENPQLIDLARHLLFRTGPPAHFLDLYFPGRPDCNDPDPDAQPLFLLHTGAVQLGAAFLAFAMQKTRLAAVKEGLYDPDTIREGLAGVDISGMVGRELLTGAFALINYGFVRRRLIHIQVEKACQMVFGSHARLELRSDVLHTAVRVDEDGLLHQQGVQAARPGGKVLPLALSSAPRAICYLLEASQTIGRAWVPHGKIYLPPESKYFQDELARYWEGDRPIISDDGLAIEALHAQAIESLEISRRDAQLEIKARLYPVLRFPGIDEE